MHRQWSSSMLLLLFGCFLLFVGSCSTQQPTTPVSSDGTRVTPQASESETTTVGESGDPDSISEAIVENETATATDSTEPEVEQISFESDGVTTGMINNRVMPVDIRTQYSWAPGGMAGGSDNLSACYRSASTIGQEPIVYTSRDYLDNAPPPLQIAESMTICYAHFSIGAMEEQVIDPTGRVIRTTQFTVDDDLYNDELRLVANDYTVLPGDLSGTYTVVAQTPDGEFTTTFDVAGQVSDGSGISPEVLVVGRGTNVQPLATSDLEYLILSNFTPEAVIDLYFYRICQNPGFRLGGGLTGRSAATLITRRQTKVNSDGQAIVRVSKDVLDELIPSQSHIVVAKDALSGESTESDFVGGSRNILASKFIAFPEDLPCPSLSTGAQPPIEPVENPPAPAWNADIDLHLSDINADEHWSVKQNENVIQSRLMSVIDQSNLAPETEDMSPFGDISFQENEVTYYAAADGDIYAKDSESDELLWAYRTKNPISLLEVAEGMLYTGQVNSYFHSNPDGSLYAIDTTGGELAWTFEPEVGISSIPVAVDGIVYAGSYEGNLYALDSATGEEVWSFTTGDWVTGVTVADGVVYFTSEDQHLYAADARNGQEQWRYDAGTWIVGSPQIDDGMLYFVGMEESTDDSGEFPQTIREFSMQALALSSSTAQDMVELEPTGTPGSEQVADPDTSSIDVMLPDQLVVEYWRMVNDGEYEAAWQLLSPDFQERNHASDYDNYASSRVDFCSTRSEEARVIQQNDEQATVSSRLVFQSGSNCEDMSLDLIYELILSPDGTIWLIDTVREE